MTIGLDTLGWRGDPALILAAFATRPGTVTAALRRLLPEWTERAACAGVGIDVFFPTKGQSAAPALAICRSCTTVHDCLTEALADPSLDYGVRGGATPRQRQAMRAEQQRRESAASDDAANVDARTAISESARGEHDARPAEDDNGGDDASRTGDVSTPAESRWGIAPTPSLCPGRSGAGSQSRVLKRFSTPIEETSP